MLLFQSHAPGDRFPVGDTEVTYLFLESVTGNTIPCGFVVTIQEGIPPPAKKTIISELMYINDM